jgi:hypothetical protein
MGATNASMLRGLTNKEVKTYVRDLIRNHGFDLERRSRPGVLTLVCPDGKKLSLHTTSASRHAAKNLARHLRSQGYEVPKP